ncbi:MAG TPA: hypothetical protein VE988_00985 [Gemmataceae bacterium]|nr:hypothetical protein [Gemmataceae bacterium]
MYRPEDIQERLRQKPFEPLRIICSEGLRYDIYHPDLVLVGTRDIMIGFPKPSKPTIYDQLTRVALVHIVALENIPAKSSTSKNGEN